MAMESTLVRRDQFSISPLGIIHKPTDAAFTPSPGDPFSGIERLGQLRNNHLNGRGFRCDDVQRIMREMWAEYVAGNQQLFKKTTNENELNTWQNTGAIIRSLP